MDQTLGRLALGRRASPRRRAHGLGLVAKKPIPKHAIIVGGVVDYDLVDYKSLTLVNFRQRMGALLGPVSLANSMCERHANAILKPRDN